MNNKKYVEVKFSNSPFSTYVFLTDIEDLKEGDKVVVDTKNGFHVVSVEGYTETLPNGLKNLKWVIQKVELEAHYERLEKEAKSKILFEKMITRQKELEEIKLFALLAESDPNMKAMFEEYKSLI